MLKGVPAVKRAGRVDQIKAILEASPVYLTVYEIAWQLHVAPSHWLRNIVRQMVADGVVHSVEAFHRSNRSKFYYGLESKRTAAQQMSMNL